MSALRFTVTDPGKSVEVSLVPEDGTISLVYAPPDEPVSFTAIVKTGDPVLQEILGTLCAAGAMPSGTQPRGMAVRLQRLAPRALASSKTVGRRVQAFVEWLVRSREDTNFTYDLTSLNMAHLAAMVSIVTGKPAADIEKYLAEPATDAELAAHYAKTIAALPPEMSALADPAPRWSRRLGWYATVRALKPRLVVETGVDKGHGALLLCAALKRNAADGHAGRYIGTDINPQAGYLLGGPYAAHGGVMIGDSIASLRTLTQPIDLFINDSDHSAAYEEAEYRTIAPLLHAQSVVIGDNSHVTDKLTRFAAETGRRFLFFREEPAAHWYAGAGIGFAFN